MDIYINSYGAYIHKSGEMFELEIEGEKKRISPGKVRSIIISTHASITTDAIKLAVSNNIDIVVLDDFGNPYGRFWHSKFGSTAYIRRMQLEKFAGEVGTNYAKRWILNKVDSQLNHLKKLEYKRTKSVELIENSISIMDKFKSKIENLSGNIEDVRNTLMGYEANISKEYYKVLSELIPEKYKFSARSSRPAKDEFNALLNYAYGILYSKVEKTLIIAGLDPFVGVLHTDNYNKKSLVFDFIENYRYLALETVFSMFSRKKIKKSYFKKIVAGITLTKDGKKALLMEFTDKLNSKVEYNSRKISNLDRIQLDAHNLANELIEKNKGLHL